MVPHIVIVVVDGVGHGKPFNDSFSHPIPFQTYIRTVKSEV
jgi:hypothetical protein